MRYGIGSISKQFAATSVLILAEEGKLRLDDPVGKYVPNLTDGDHITVRQVLSHTAGYRDYWPQDFLPPFMARPTTPDAILDRFARSPLDYEPGDEWQYSNTGFVAAGRIVELASGMPLQRFLEQRIFGPLKMSSVVEHDTRPLPPEDPAGYTRYALGAPLPAPKEGRGWLFGAAGLAMTPADLARWDVAMIRRELLRPESWKAMQISTRLNNGRDAAYGLGVYARSDGQQRLIAHGGAVMGFLAENRIWPDQGAALVVLVNGDYGDPGAIADRIGEALPLAARPSAQETAAARAFFEELVKGRVDRTRLTEAGASYFTPAALADHAGSLGGLGALASFEPVSRRVRGGFSQEVYKAKLGDRSLRIVARAADGRYEQFLVLPGD